jgi:hypothetical protein
LEEVALLKELKRWEEWAVTLPAQDYTGIVSAPNVEPRSSINEVFRASR